MYITEWISLAYNKCFFEQYEHLAKDRTNHILLESGRDGRYSIVGLEPKMIVRGKGADLFVESDCKEEHLKGNLLSNFQEVLGRYHISNVEGLPDFQGGWMGYFSYDAYHAIETVEEIAKDDLELPELLFFMFEDVFVFDHQYEKLFIISNKKTAQEARGSNEYWKHRWLEPVEKVTYHLSESSQGSFVQTSLNEEEFIAAVNRVKDYIVNGDVFQVNLSVREGKKLATHPMEIYKALRQINPSPYMCYLSCGDFQIVSGSPELLVKNRNGLLSTRPIAGTRSRGTSVEEENRLVEELRNDEKEQAEHLMLVDLERNDLGRVSQYGTVEVNEFMVIEKYSHVMHLVSNVQGKLRSEFQEMDVVKAMFPGGTITGTPKVRTIEIIEELEPVKRGIYTGSIGWIGFNQDMELNIVIRTMVVKDGIGYVQAGAGIVIDSVPNREYKETFKKASALWRAKEMSESIRNGVQL